MNAELSRLLDAQGGVVTSAQALTFLTRRGLEAHLNCGALQKIWHGIYGRGEVTVALRLRGLDLAAGTTVAACMGTAAAAYGFDTERSTDLHVLNPGGRQLRSADGLIVHRRDGRAVDLGRRTAGHHARVDGGRGGTGTASTSSAGDAGRRAAKRHVQPRRHVSERSRRQSGRRGIVTARELLALASPQAESPMESEARLVMIDGGLPPPVLQYEIVDAQGRTWRLDFAWPDLRVAAEYDGVDWHSGPQAFFRDRRRAAALQDLGWVVVPIVAEDVRYRPAELVRRLEARLKCARAA